MPPQIKPPPPTNQNPPSSGRGRKREGSGAPGTAHARPPISEPTAQPHRAAPSCRGIQPAAADRDANELEQQLVVEERKSRGLLLMHYGGACIVMMVVVHGVVVVQEMTQSSEKDLALVDERRRW